MPDDEQLRGRLRVLSRAYRRVGLPHIRERVADETASLGTPEAYRFLIEQARRGDPGAGEAIAAVHDAAPDVLPDLMQALRKSPDAEGLARALPSELPPEMAYDLMELVPRVADPVTLRWLTERIATAFPNRIGELTADAAQREDTVAQFAVVAGLADAGDERCAGKLRELLLADLDPSALRLILSSRATWDMPEAQKRAAELLASDYADDRGYAITLVGQAGWVGLAPDALRRAVFDDDVSVRSAALQLQWLYAEADPAALTEVVEEVCDELAAAAGPASGDGATRCSEEQWEAVAEGIREACGHARRLHAAVAWNDEAREEASALICRASIRAAPPLEWRLRQDGAPEPLAVAYGRLLELELDLAGELWKAGGAQVYPVLQKLAGLITVDYAARAEPYEAGAGPVRLIGLLRELAADAARLMLLQTERETAPGRDELLREVSLCRHRRMAVLRQLASAREATAHVGDELRESRRREAQALERATAELGAAPVAECQTAVNELPGGAVPSVERELRQLMRRAASAGAGGSEPPDLSPMAPVIAEQVLQADLLASMAIGECASPPEVLVESLHSRSAVVREAAERLLARQGKRAAPALRQVLESAPDPPVAARALEVLRCIEEPALGHAREAAGADHELLRAAGVKCLGAGGGEDDVEAVVSAAGDRSELVQIVAVEGLGALDPASHIDVLFEALGSPRFSVRDKAMQALARLELERLERLARRAEEEGNHWQRVGMSGMVESLRAGGDPAARRWRGVPFAVAGDWELGARMAVAGDGPWQWGLTGLCPESAERFDLYADLLEKDEELREAWEVWMRTGNFPYKPLPRLQEIAAEGGPNSEAAIWLAIDALHAAIWGEVFVPASDYYRMTVDEDLLEQVADMASRVFRLCTPEVVAQLAVPNPSAASVWPEVMAPGDPEAAGDRLVRAFVEELKARMRREFGRQVALPDDEGAFRRAIEREWERLLPHQDLFYGFRVVPEVRLEDFGRYCGDRACNREYRRMISSYLAYLATAAPCPRETRSAAREALRGAYSSRLRAAAQEITKDQAADFKAAIDNLEASLERALDEFDIYWASPQPLMPLGTLDMAWAEPRQVPEGRRTDLPERHLPFAHMVEQLVQDVIRQFRERAEYLTEAALGKEDEAPPSLEEIAAAGLSREAGYRGDFVEGLIDGTESAEVVARQLGSIDHEEAPVQVSRLPIDGEDVACVDIREASRLLSRSMDTLRRREDAGEFTFVRHEGRRYLPLDQLPAVRVVVRSMKEWEQILGVSRQTVHTWMSELPDHLDPLEMEARLLERARRRGR